MAQATVTVRGNGVAPAEPDEAELRIEITDLAKTPEAALAEVAERSQTLTRILDGLGVPAEARSTTEASVREEREYERQRYIHKGFRAVSQVVLRLRDREVLGPIMRRASEEADARIDGPRWRIAPDNPARAEACREAARDADRKATAYAEALGGRRGEVLAVGEPGLVFEHRRIDVPPPVAAPAAMMSEGSEIQIEEGGLEVRAAVDVTFAFEPRAGSA